MMETVLSLMKRHNCDEKNTMLYVERHGRNGKSYSELTNYADGYAYCYVVRYEEEITIDNTVKLTIWCKY